MVHWMPQMERECRLFEAGDYPDKNLNISQKDLQLIAENSPSEIPVCIEHMDSTPFDGCLGTIAKLHVRGKELWGRLLQSVEANDFTRKSGANKLSIRLDPEHKRITEVSFVNRPRVANAMVFRDDGGGTQEVGSAGKNACAIFMSEIGEELKMVSAKQFAEGLIGYLRTFIGDGKSSEENTRNEASSTESTFAAEQARFAEERSLFRQEKAENELRQLKQQGFIRATELAENSAKALLVFGQEASIKFNEEAVSVAGIFRRFLAANGPVVPMGEMVSADSTSGSGSGARLVSMAENISKQEGIPFHAALMSAANQYPDLARSAREEVYQ